MDVPGTHQLCSIRGDQRRIHGLPQLLESTRNAVLKVQEGESSGANVLLREVVQDDSFLIASRRSGTADARERAGRVKGAERRSGPLTRPSAPGKSIAGATVGSASRVFFANRPIAGTFRNSAAACFQEQEPRSCLMKLNLITR